MSRSERATAWPGRGRRRTRRTTTPLRWRTALRTVATARWRSARRSGSGRGSGTRGGRRSSIGSAGEAITAEAARTHFRSAGSPGIVQPMRCQVLACDYDGTLASDGRIAPETMRALGRVRDSGRRIVLVTGRQLDDLLGACPGIDFFDWVVAENGAVLYEPRGKRVDDLAAPPPAAFLAALERAGVPFSTGRVVVATVVPHQTAVRRAIHDPATRRLRRGGGRRGAVGGGRGGPRDARPERGRRAGVHRGMAARGPARMNAPVTARGHTCRSSRDAPRDRAPSSRGPRSPRP